jgi:hypothetical protein
MTGRVTTVERAYQLASSGEVFSLTEIRKQLRAEGYHDAPAHLAGIALVGELRRLLAVARKANRSGA